MMVRALFFCSCGLSAQLASQSVALHGRIAFPLSSSQRTPTLLVDRGRGVWGGVALEARVAQFSATVAGIRGGLGASSQFPERDGGEVSAVVRYEPVPPVALHVHHSTRAFSSAAGRQTWTLWGVGAMGSLNLGTSGLRASGGFTYLPFVTVTGEPESPFGVAADVALAVTPRRTPIVLTAGYRIEKFVFAAASNRAEQFEVFTLSVGLRMQRRDGRWGLGR